ncbi:MAG: glycosyltransferase [Proteobacteria bacterium]|nr:glycosyltransferase [Pseudomonadota bacterium]
MQIIDSLRAGGKERQLIELLRVLAPLPEFACELVVMSDDMHYELPPKLELSPYRLVRHRRLDAGIYRHLDRILQSVKPDIVHSWSSMCTVYAAPMAWWRGARFINGQIRDARPGIDLRDPDYLRARLMLPFTDVVVANSQAGLRAYRIPQRKGVVIHNGYRADRFTGLPSVQGVRAELGIGTRFVVGMVGSFSHLKDYESFFSAALRLIELRDDVTFVAMGDGPDLPKFQSRFSVHPRMRLLGRRADIERIVNAFDVGVLLSTAGEGSPNAVAEYMMLSKPVVATDEGGTPELVIDGVTGYLVRNRDTASIVDWISALLGDSALANRLGARGRLRITDEYSIERMQEAYAGLYRRLERGRS